MAYSRLRWELEQVPWSPGLLRSLRRRCRPMVVRSFGHARAHSRRLWVASTFPNPAKLLFASLKRLPHGSLFFLWRESGPEAISRFIASVLAVHLASID